jgi:Uma2 family endonuclease
MRHATADSPAEEPQPAWAIATLYPLQGEWEESDYLEATHSTNRFVELVDGSVEVLPMPKTGHQRIVHFLDHALSAFLVSHPLGEVLTAVLRVRLWRRTFREPALIFMLAEHADRKGEDCWQGADLVMEVVSPDTESRQRDWVTKREEYARAGIAEYWIVDPQDQRLVVLKLEGKQYVVHSEAGANGEAHSALLNGLSVDAGRLWAAAHPS